jgi:glycerol-3-phosphate acyltransferase PlsY
VSAAQLIALVASYFLGAIPTSYLVARFAGGIDLHTVGSKNLGATNLYRALGWRYAIPVALFDIAKGVVPVAVFARLAHGAIGFALLCGAAAIMGHVFSVFVRFRGGKGVATAAGVMLALSPLPLVVCLGVWLLVLWLSGYVSLASLIAAAVLPLAVWLLQPARRELLWLDVPVVLGIIWMHRANIRRLLTGTEHRFRRGGPRGAAAGGAS